MAHSHPTNSKRPRTLCTKVRGIFFAHSSCCHIYYPRSDSMNKKHQEQQNRQKNLNKFNSVTEKVKPENQNQTHNVRSEAVEPKNRKV